jgi:hypothetical protein
VKLKLDLHDVYNRGEEIERALRSIIDEAVAKKAPLVEIIPGKGSGQLKKRVLRFLDRKEIKALYHRVEKDSDNFGRVFVHFRWKCIRSRRGSRELVRPHVPRPRPVRPARGRISLRSVATDPLVHGLPAIRHRGARGG